MDNAYRVTYGKNSNRSRDENGFLRVTDCVLTAEQVNQYKGREIKGWDKLYDGETLGLDPEKKYGVYRPGSEIEKAVNTYDDLFVTDDHVAIDPANLAKDKIFGMVGSNATYSDGQLFNNVSIMDGKAIKYIEDADKDTGEGKKELSCGYGYDIVPEIGSFKGEPYQFKMINLRGNHVALVKTGRVDGAQIADSEPEDKQKEIAKKILGICKDADYEGKEDDQISAILKAAIELSAIQEREAVHSANDSGKHIFKKGKPVKKSGMRMFLDAFFGDSKEDEDCRMDKKARDAEIVRSMKEVAGKDASEFEGGEAEKGKTITEMASKLGDGEEETEEEKKEREKKEKMESDKKAKDKAMKDKMVKDKAAKDAENGVGSEMVEEANAKTESANKKAAEDAMFDSKVAEAVTNQIKIRNHVVTKSLQIVGKLPDAIMMDASPEKIVDYTLKLKGQNVDGKSLSEKLAMFEVLGTQSKPAMIFDTVTQTKPKSTDIFNVMRGK